MNRQGLALPLLPGPALEVRSVRRVGRSTVSEHLPLRRARRCAIPRWQLVCALRRASTPEFPSRLQINQSIKNIPNLNTFYNMADYRNNTINYYNTLMAI